MEHTFNGLNRAQMNQVLNTLCELEDKIPNLSEEERSSYGVAIKCVCQILVRMTDNRQICWDRKD